MELPLLVLIATFAMLLVMNVPIAVAIGLSAFASVLVATGNFVTATTIVAQQLAKGIENFSLKGARIPEPSTLLLAIVALGVVGWWRQRKHA